MSGIEAGKKAAAYAAVDEQIQVFAIEPVKQGACLLTSLSPTDFNPLNNGYDNCPGNCCQRQDLEFV